MTATTPTSMPSRTPAAIREWLSTHSPEDAMRFESEYRAGLDHAIQAYDLEAVESTVIEWWAQIWGRTQRLSPEEIDQLEQFEATGDFSTLLPRSA